MQQGNNNVINNYKGVMLCSRPNQVNQNHIEKPFCARVVPPQKIGLVPARKDILQRQQKKKLPSILGKHKKWLQQFQGLQKHKKQSQQIQKILQQQKFRKIRQIAQNDRQRSKKMKQQYNQTANNVLNILDDKPIQKVQLNAQNLRKLNQQNQQNEKRQQNNNNIANKQFKKKKKLDKPLWAQTQKQIQNKQQQQVDQLLNFFDQNPIQQYSQDRQVQQILKNLKQKIDQIKKQQNWKENQTKKIKQKKKINNNQQKQQYDKQSNYSIQSDGKSVASQKTQKKIQDLKEKLQKKNQGQDQWDKFTTTSKHTATIQDKIAKNVADQVLRNYPNLRGIHSNTSIRKLLESQAARALYQPISRPVITTIVREKIPLDSSNLPYLHRNPAV